MIDLSSFVILAKDPAPGSSLMGFVPLIVMGVFGYLLFIRPMSAERRKQREAIDALRKNDRVITIGGIVGTVAEVPGESDLITIKVDDGTRIKFRRSAIQGPYDPDPKPDNAKTEKK